MIIVEVWTGEDRRGTISWDWQKGDGGEFVTSPEDDSFLLHLLQQPLWVQIAGKMQEVNSQDDPILFLTSMCLHYKSGQGVRCGEAEDTDEHSLAR